MATIVEIAKIAGVSPSTASIVLSGAAEERKISSATQNRVLDAARKLGYSPNIMARRLRTKTDAKILVTTYQSIDARSLTMFRFNRGLYSKAFTMSDSLTLNIMHYQSSELMKEASIYSINTCNGAIICNCSTNDIDFLKTFHPQFPAVIYNSVCDGFYSVTIDDVALGREAAEILHKQDCGSAAYLTNVILHRSSVLRRTSFEKYCKELEMDFRGVIRADGTMNGGYQAAQEILESDQLPEGIFIANELQAFGAIKRFREAGVRIPDDIRIIAVGNGPHEMADFCEPKISTFYLPLEEMAAKCLEVLVGVIRGELIEPQNFLQPYSYIPRESCR